MLWLLAKVTFYRGWLALPDFPAFPERAAASMPLLAPANAPPQIEILRAERISNSVENSIRRERTFASERLLQGQSVVAGGSPSGPERTVGPQRLGSSYRRPASRVSQAARKRDQS